MGLKGVDSSDKGMSSELLFCKETCKFTSQLGLWQPQWELWRKLQLLGFWSGEKTTVDRNTQKAIYLFIQLQYMIA